MAIIKFKDLWISKPIYGANLPGKNKGLYKYLTQTDIASKEITKYVDETQNKILKKNDFLISRAGTILPYFHQDDESIVYAGYLIKYSLNLKLCVPKYVYYYFLGPGKKEINRNINTGSIMPKLNPNSSGHLKLNLPILETQQQIIDIIEPLESAILKINKLEDVTKAVLKKLENNKNSFFLADVAEAIRSKPRGIAQVSAKVMSKRSPILKGSELSGTYKTNSFYAEESFLLINTIRTYLEKFAILSFPADVNGTVGIFKIKDKWTSILHNLLNDDFWQSTKLLSQGTKMPVIKINDLMTKIKFKEVVCEIESIDKFFILLAKIKIVIEKLKELKIKLLIK